MLEAAERSFNVGVGREFSALGLGEAFQNRRQMGTIDVLGLTVVAAQREHGECYLVLTVGREAAHGFKGFFQKLRHVCKVSSSPYKMKAPERRYQ